MRSGVLCFYRIGICIFLKRDSELRRTSEEIFFLYTSNPSPKKLPYLRCLPYITNVTPRNATRHSRREVDIRFCFLFCQYFFQPPRPTGTPPIPLCDTPQCCGTRQGRRTNTIHRKVLTSSSVFCIAKYRGGVRRTEGLKNIHSRGSI